MRIILVVLQRDIVDMYSAASGHPLMHCIRNPVSNLCLRISWNSTAGSRQLAMLQLNPVNPHTSVHNVISIE